MKERPILFSGPMVRAILDGRKTQTRRVVNVEKWKSGKWARDFVFCDDPNLYRAGDFNWVADLARLSGDRIDNGQHLSIPFRHKDDPVIPWEECGRERIHCPHGWPGMMGEPADRLWVKETHRFDGIDQRIGVREKRIEELSYRADMEGDPSCDDCAWRPSIFMPRWASRITLEIAAVRVERLQDISEADAVAEGIEPFHSDGPNKHTISIDGVSYNAPRAAGVYEMLWNHINGADSWDANPWVWVIEFRRL